MGSRGASSSIKTTANKEQRKQELKDELRAKAEAMNKWADEHTTSNGGMTEEDARRYEAMNREIADIKYDLEKNYFKTITEKNIKDDRETALEKPVYVQARKDVLRNKDIYDALEQASWGVRVNADTPVDDILEGRNKKVSPNKLYNTFSKTRAQLKKIYGDTITLYRVEGLQKEKATKNYGSSVAYTKNYGSNVKSYKIKVDDIVAINSNRRGTYEDIIVAQGGINKYLKKKRR